MTKIRTASQGYIERLIMAHPYHKSPIDSKNRKISKTPKNCMESSGLKFFSYIQLSH